MAAVIQPTSCSTFIQIWVDTNALQNQQQTGVYLVDNNLNHGSTGEGTTSLMTQVPAGTNVCWSLLNVDPTSDTILQIQNFGNSDVFGASGTPQMVNATTWTGTVENAVQASYTINFSAQIPGASGITTTVTPSFKVL